MLFPFLCAWSWPVELGLLGRSGEVCRSTGWEFFGSEPNVERFAVSGVVVCDRGGINVATCRTAKASRSSSSSPFSDPLPSVAVSNVATVDTESVLSDRKCPKEPLGVKRLLAHVLCCDLDKLSFNYLHTAYVCPHGLNDVPSTM